MAPDKYFVRSRSLSFFLSLSRPLVDSRVDRPLTLQPAERIVREGTGPHHPVGSLRAITVPGDLGVGRAASRSCSHCTPQGFQAAAGDSGRPSFLQGVPVAVDPIDGP